MKKSLIIIAAAFILIAALAGQATGTMAVNSDLESAHYNSLYGASPDLWTQTTQTDFTQGVPDNNVDPASIPGSVRLSSSSGFGPAASDNEEVHTESSGFTLIKSLNFNKSGPVYNEIRIDTNLRNTGGGSVTGSIRLNDTEIFTHTTASSTYFVDHYQDIFDFSGYPDGAYTLKLYLDSSGGTGYNQLFEVYTTSPELVVVTTESPDNPYNNEVSHTGDLSWTLKKTLTFNKSGTDYDNLLFKTNLKLNQGNTAVWLRLDMDGSPIVEYFTTEHSYIEYTFNYNFSSGGDGPHTVNLYLRTGQSNRIAYNSRFEIWSTSPALIGSDNVERSVEGFVEWQLMKILYFNKSESSSNLLRIDSNLRSTGAVSGSSVRLDDIEMAAYSTTATNYQSYLLEIDITSLGIGQHSVKLYLRSGNKNKPAYNSVFEIYTEVNVYAASGSIASAVLDTESGGSRWNAIFWNCFLPTSTGITLEVRASDDGFLKNAADPSWETVAGDSYQLSGLPPGQYKQWRATLTTSDVSVTPVLEEVRLYYFP